MEEPRLIKKGETLSGLRLDRKLFRLKQKSGRIEAVTVEMEPGAELGDTYSHEGEEIHMVIEGVIEYVVDEKRYILEQGDWLWHDSTLPHHARNLGDGAARYITIGTPPTFM